MLRFMVDGTLKEVAIKAVITGALLGAWVAFAAFYL